MGESAEQRDLNMFHRLVNGIRDRQMDLVQENKSSNAAAAFYDPAHALTEAEQSLSHIIHTRNAPVTGTTAGNNSNCNNNNASSIIPFSKNNYKNKNNINCHNQQQQHFLDNNREGLATAALNTGLDGNHNNEWSVSGFDDSSSSLNLESEFQQQQKISSDHQTAATASSSLAHNFTTATTVTVATTDSSTTPNALQQYRYLSSNSMTEGTVG